MGFVQVVNCSFQQDGRRDVTFNRTIFYWRFSSDVTAAMFAYRTML